MMHGIARRYDKAQGVCYNQQHIHESVYPKPVMGYIDDGNSTVYAQGQVVARVGDIVRFDCGHVGHIEDGTTMCIVGGIPLAQIESPVGRSKGGDVVGIVIEGTTTVGAK